MSNLTDYLHPRSVLKVLREHFEYHPKDGGFYHHLGEKRLCLGEWRLSHLQLKQPHTPSTYVGRVPDLVWLWHHEEFPPDRLQFVNGIKSDCRIENLGMVLCDGHVEGFADQWTVYDHHRKRYGPLGTYSTWREAVAAWECRDLI